MKIKLGTKCQSTLYGKGTVVELYDDTMPYMFYPVLVCFIKNNITQEICFDYQGNTMKQHTDTPDAMFYE